MLQVDRLDKLIADSPLSINQIAELAEISPEYVWALRKGKAPRVSAAVLARLAEVFGVSLDYLMGIERDDNGVPVPEMELIGIVARLNSLPSELRRAASNAISAMLDFATHTVQPYNERTQRWVWFLDQLSDAEYEEYMREFSARAAHNADASNPARIPARRAIGSQTGE